MARRATAITQVREQAQGSVLLLDSGNSLFNATGRSSATADRSEAALPIEAMNLMGYDAMSLGEQDLAAALEVVQSRFQEASFPILTANLDAEGLLPNTLPYVLREVDGHTVAMIGAMATLPKERTQTLGITLTVNGAIDSVQRVVTEVQDRADVIILLSSLSVNSNIKLAQEIPGLDVIIGAAGGAQVKAQEVPGPGGARVVLHAAGSQGKAMGVLVLGFDDQGRVVTFSGRLVDLLPAVASDPAMVQVMQKYGVKP